jgi:hypothetical protein
MQFDGVIAMKMRRAEDVDSLQDRIPLASQRDGMITAGLAARKRDERS